jgi:hypothetical protein
MQLNLKNLDIDVNKLTHDNIDIVRTLTYKDIGNLMYFKLIEQFEIEPFPLFDKHQKKNLRKKYTNIFI